tara:strand:+ start:372 stop:2378 length:2007 start_codon:yes stop_codon:yes gene_type:complete
MILVIVESATKSKKIQGFLGEGYKVIASFGHFTDLPKDRLGININSGNWECEYVATKLDIIKNIKTNVKNADQVLIASDQDREGEAIAYHIQQLVLNDKPRIPIERMVFNEITRSAITSAINNTTTINMNIVKAQEARRILDRLAGYRLSPLLWDVFNDHHLSCGRVQSTVLDYIVSRMESITNFIENNDQNKEHIWKIHGDFKGFKGAIYGNNMIYTKEEELLDALRSFKRDEYTIKHTTEDKAITPPPPYITTSIQIDCSSKLGISSSVCMSILQKLYEDGLITYHRTDSIYVSKEFQRKATEYIKIKYGDKYSAPKYSGGSGAHECIRVTDVNKENIPDDGQRSRVYHMIWCRCVASQMSSAQVQIFTYMFINKPHQFKSSSEAIVFEGFKRVYGEEPSDINTFIPPKSTILEKVYSKSTIKKAKSLYSEGEIVKKMEKEGIGRPSTYASIVKVLFTREYIKYGSNPQNTQEIPDYKIDLKTKKETKNITKHSVCENSNAKKLLEPTDTGIKVDHYLRSNISFITNTDFTRQMESGLDRIEKDEIKKSDVIEPFNTVIETVLTENKTSTTSSSTPRKPYKEITKNEVCKTKYGWCIITPQKRFINIEGFLEQMGRTHDSLEQKEIDLLATFPNKTKSMTKVMIGRYGIYSNSKKKITAEDFAKML